MTSFTAGLSDAQVAEVEYTAFAATQGGQAVTARLIVRRVKGIPSPSPVKASCSPPGAITPSSPTRRSPCVQAEEHHRGHAQAEQVFADWTDGPLAAPLLAAAPDHLARQSPCATTRCG